MATFVTGKTFTVTKAGPSWTDALFAENSAKHVYTAVGTKRTLKLKGAPLRWSKNFPNDIYVPSLRVVGTEAEIREAFTSQGLAAPRGMSLDSHIAGAYRQGNFKSTMKPAFDAEVKAFTEWQERTGGKKVRAARAAAPAVDFEAFKAAKAVHGSTTVVDAPPKAKAPKAASTGTTGRTQPLATRLAKATAEGRFIDVSKLDTATNVGARVHNDVGPNSGKIHVAGLNIISSDGVKYAFAVNQLGLANASAYIAAFNERVAARARGATSPAPVPAAVPVSRISPRHTGGVVVGARAVSPARHTGVVVGGGRVSPPRVSPPRTGGVRISPRGSVVPSAVGSPRA